MVHLLWLLPLALLLLAWRRARAFDARVRAALDVCRDAPAAPLGVAADVAADEAAERIAARSGLAAGAGRGWFAIEQDGAMRLREDGPWLPFRATQVFAAGAPWFAWVARFRLAGLPLRVVDALGPDGGWLEARLCGVVPVARARDAATTRAQRMRYLAELPWCPGAWRTNPALRVESIGAERMRVGLHDGSAAVDLELGPTGDVVGATALRPRATPAGSVDTPWAGRFADHRELDGLRMPTSATVAWRIDGREFAYWRARITRVAWR